MDDLLQALARYDSPTLANAIETLDIQSRDVGFADNRVKCMFPELGRMVGYAATATIVARGAPAGRLGRRGQRRAVRRTCARSRRRAWSWSRTSTTRPPTGRCGARSTRRSSGRSAASAAVTDGSVRDFDEARGMGFHFFASGPSVSHAYVRVETIGEPVEIGGLEIAPGDLLHADQHGVLKIPHEIAAELPAAADRVIETEQALLRWVRSDEFDPDRLPEMRARH